SPSIRRTSVMVSSDQNATCLASPCHPAVMICLPLGVKATELTHCFCFQKGGVGGATLQTRSDAMATTERCMSGLHAGFPRQPTAADLMEAPRPPSGLAAPRRADQPLVARPGTSPPGPSPPGGSGTASPSTASRSPGPRPAPGAGPPSRPPVAWPAPAAPVGG